MAFEKNSPPIRNTKDQALIERPANIRKGEGDANQIKQSEIIASKQDAAGAYYWFIIRQDEWHILYNNPSVSFLAADDVITNTFNVIPDKDLLISWERVV